MITPDHLTPASDVVGLILQHPDVVKQPDSRGEATAWCPWHDDKSGGNASLTINVKKMIVKCFVCDNGGAVKLAKAWNIEVTRSGDLPPWKRPIERTHDYQGAEGELLLQIVVHGRKANGQKDVSQRRPDPSKPDGFTWNAKGVELVPYNLVAVLAAALDTIIYIVEGEKDADTLNDAGFVATTNVGGRGQVEEVPFTLSQGTQDSDLGRQRRGRPETCPGRCLEAQRHRCLDQDCRAAGPT